jgi:uncharacterized protein YjcR
VDWNVIKAEYIAGGTSYRKLAEKYNVSFNTIQGIAKQEKWVELRNQAKDKSTTKMVNSIAKGIAKNAVKINTVADKLLDKIIVLLDELEVADSQTIKQCTSALKDIKDIKGVKSEIDLKEQEARIDKLRKDIEADKISEDKPCGVVLMPPVMDALVPPSEEDEDADG